MKNLLVVLRALILVAASAAPVSAGLLDGAPREAITTGVADAVPTSSWVSIFLQDVKPANLKSLNFSPGYRHARLQSYCLHAGTYGPTKGDGYLLAPLKGDRAELVRSIMERSVAHPEIDQEDIQRLLWGVDAYAKFDDYPSDFQSRVTPLLMPDEIASMNADPDATREVTRTILNSIVPAEVTSAISEVQHWREAITNPSLAFPELAQAAVLQGAPPLGEGSREVPAGTWSYAGNGTYVRFFPETYKQTDVEIFKPPSYQVALDALGRVTHLSASGFAVDATYADKPDTIDFKGTMIRAWRFRKLALTGPKTGQHAIIRNRGWVLDSRDVAFTLRGDSIHGRSTLNQIRVIADIQWAGAKIADAGDALVKGVDRVYDAKGKFDAAKDAREAATEPDAQKAGEELTGMEHLAGGLHDVVAGNPYYWIGDTYAKVAIIVAGAASKLDGPTDASKDSGSSDNMNFPLLAQPANTSQQRLGVSARSS